MPLDEPSVPMQNVHFDSVGQQQCLVSEEVVVSSAPSTEVAQSNVLLVSSGDGLDKLAASILSKLSDFQSARRPPPPLFRVIQWGVKLVSLVLFCLVSVSLVLLIPILWGSLPPPHFLPNPVQPVFRLPTAPVSGGTPHGPVASDQRIQQLQEELASTRHAISTLCDSGVRPPQLLFDSASSLSRTWRMLGNRLHGLGFRHLPSLRLPRRVLLVRSSTLLFLVHLGDVHLTRLSVLQDIHLARGVILLLARGVGSQTSRLMMRTHRLKLTDNGTINRMKRTIFVLPRWIFY